MKTFLAALAASFVLTLSACDCHESSTGSGGMGGTGGVGGSTVNSCDHIEDSTEFNTYVDADCLGDRAFIGDFKGATVVRVLSNDPVYNGTLLGRAEEVPEIWTLDTFGACVPFEPSEGFPPPYYRWPVYTCE